MPLVWYVAKFGITISSVENLLVKFRRGENIMPKVYDRKSRVDMFQHLVRREVKLDLTVPMHVVLNNR